MKKLFFEKKIVVILLSLFTLSCDKAQLDKETLLDSKKKSENSTSATNISVNWNNWTEGEKYTVSKAIADFGDINNFTQAEQDRTQISSSRLRVTYLKNQIGSAGGVITTTNVSEHSGYEINYKVKFHADFDFGTGGRVGWGIDIGDGADVAETGDGGSFRLAWAKDGSGNTYLKPVVYYADQPSTSSHDFGKRYPATGSITGSVYYNIKMVFKANTNLNRNGKAELYINGVQVLNTPIRWTKNHSKRKAKQLLFSNYRSGSTSSSDANVWFDDFTMENFAVTYTPTWCDNAYIVTYLHDAQTNVDYTLTRIKHKDSDGNIIRLRHGHANHANGETGTNFAKRLDGCVVFNASMRDSEYEEPITWPVGIQIINSTIVKSTTYKRYTLGIKSQNQLLAYAPYTTAATILNDGAIEALTAFVPIIENFIPTDTSIMHTVTNLKEKHPRQVIAQYSNGDILILSCSGRKLNGGGDGMDALDLRRILSALGVKFAFNLDGGGSTTTVLNGERITPLIDENGTLERPRGNFLYVENKHSN